MTLPGSLPARPVGARLGGEPFLPEVGAVYWVETTILAPGVGDPEARRPVVVVAAPATVDGTATVVSRSTTDGFGVDHPAGGHLGFSVAGRFSRRHPVPCRLWTARDVTLVGPLDHDLLAAVVARFTP